MKGNIVIRQITVKPLGRNHCRTSAYCYSLCSNLYILKNTDILFLVGTIK